ncbi:MAG: mannose-1-phosphate guanylyltransferase/mannose-6-phosphate isomerase [Pseudomonadota bacterium]
MAIIKPVVMAGGSGTRLWPLSRGAQPKQYQALISERTMLQETLDRVSTDEFSAPAVIGGARHRSVIEEQLPAGKIVLEPFGRNTGPAAIAAALLAQADSDDTLVLLLPADHHIADPAAFREAVSRGVAAAEEGYLVTLGITPDGPETGYGYIKRGADLTEGTYTVDAFVEKPARDVAEQYLAEGTYAWNAGIFLFRASDLLTEAAQHAPAMLDSTKAAWDAASRDGRVIQFTDEAFGAIEGDSVDYAIMEQTERAAVVSPVTIGWNDIGSWAAVKTFSEGSDEAQSIAVDCPGTLIKSAPGAPLVAAVGLEGYVVVATKDSVLIVPEDRAQDVKTIVEELKARERTDLL